METLEISSEESTSILPPDILEALNMVAEGL